MIVAPYRVSVKEMRMVKRKVRPRTSSEAESGHHTPAPSTLCSNIVLKSQWSVTGAHTRD